ncbi:hypothetical protein Emed_005206 [Eimeria media]
MPQDKPDEQQDTHQATPSHSGIDTDSNTTSDLEALQLGSASSTGRADASGQVALKPLGDTHISAADACINTHVVADNTSESRAGSSGLVCGVDNSSDTFGLYAQGEAEGKLSPESFKSLGEAFQSSLRVIRCLRTALQLLHFTERCDDDKQQRLPADAATTAAKLIASQKAFVAEEDAYAHLLEERSTEQGKGLIHPLRVSSAGSSNAPNALEYELSVCKALLLLQQLTPSSVTTTEDILTPSCPPLASSLLFDRPTSNSEKNACMQSNGAVSKRVLDALLRVRLLQGTQQLLRADFLKLLHEQRRQHQQLQQAVQATVTKLEAERDTLLGRMQKLSAVVNRK